MASFAIKRADGTVDKAEGTSVEDVTARYGAPGNGSIEPWSDTLTAANTFATPEDQAAAWRAVAEKEGQFKAEKAAEKTQTVASSGIVTGPAGPQQEEDLSTLSRSDLEALAAEKGIENPGSFENKAALIAAIEKGK